MMRDTARRFGRVFSGGSQRVWGDYNWFHRMIYGGAIGEVKEAWVNVGGPSAECYLLRNHYLMALIGIGGWDLPLGDLIILLSQGEALDHFEIILVEV